MKTQYSLTTHMSKMVAVGSLLLALTAVFVCLWLLQPTVLADDGPITKADVSPQPPALPDLPIPLPDEPDMESGGDPATPMDTLATWFSADLDPSFAVAWGDVDGDGDLDLAAANSGPNIGAKLYLNEGTLLDDSAIWESDNAFDIHSRDVAWGDMDGDGLLDLAIANNEADTTVYLNDRGALDDFPSWFSTDIFTHSHSVAWGDVNGDGWLDLAVGNDGSNVLYLNIGGTLDSVPAWVSGTPNDTRSLELGDVNGDGALDMVEGNFGQPNRIYLNDGAGGFNGNPINCAVPPPPDVVCFGPGNDTTLTIALGDVDGDDDLDIAVGNLSNHYIYENKASGTMWPPLGGSFGVGSASELTWGDVDNDGDLDLALANFQVNEIYLNTGGMIDPNAAWISADSDAHQGVAWGDMDGDGDLDLAAANSIGPNKVYLNNGAMLQTAVDPLWSSLFNTPATSVAWGDVDNDGDLDLAVGNDYLVETFLYFNDNGELQDTPGWISDDPATAQTVAWGDVNGDGWLDLAVGNIGFNRVYLNIGGTLDTAYTWESDEPDSTYTIAWVDVNGDGDLDLAAGNYNTKNRIYMNVDGQLETTASWKSSESDGTVGMAWGDADGDGDPDMAVGNWFQPNKLYLNNNGSLVNTAVWQTADADRTWSVSWGDVDGDGDVDLAAGNDQGPNKLYQNLGSELTAVAVWQSGDTDGTLSIVWGDVNGDGWLDLAAGNFFDPNAVYFNLGGTLQTAAERPWQSGDQDGTYAVALGDMNQDGVLDLAAANNGDPVIVYLGKRPSHPLISSEIATVVISNTIAPANGYHLSGTMASGIIPVTYTLYHPTSEPVRQIRAYYSLDGGGSWLPAVATSDTITTNLTTGRLPVSEIIGPVSLTQCSSPNIPIPDNNPAGTSDIINIATTGIISDVTIALTATHTWVGDLAFTLENNNSAIATTLVDRPGLPIPDMNFGCNDNNLVNFILRDGSIHGPHDAACPNMDITPAYPPGFDWDPIEPLANFAGSVLDGNWILSVVDNAGGDTGTFNSWCMTVNGVETAVSTTPSDNTHVYKWDVFASGLFGRSDDVVFRIEALPYLEPLTDTIPGPFQRPYVAANTYPFRVSGTQIQVISGTNPAANALVFNLPNGQIVGGEPIANDGGLPFLTDEFGFLQGRGALQVGDQLVALLPDNLPTMPTPTCSAPNLAIPDDDPNGASDTIVIDEEGTLSDLNVALNIEHTWVGDLTFELEHLESGTSITLIDRPGLPANPPYGCSGNNIGAVLDDEAFVPAENECNATPPAIEGELQPNDDLSSFDGDNYAGTWQLTAYDAAAGDIGTINEWCIIPEIRNESFIEFKTSAAPTETGLDMFSVTGSGLQTLQVSDDNTLLLFNLDISLEWDARNDETFLSDLEDAVTEASAVLYDVTNGQVAIGEVRLHQNKANWLTSDVIVYASSNYQPRANIGGIVLTGTNDIGPTGVISNAYLPGQVTMGPSWDPFGEAQFDLGTEWYRALAHELAHYLLFLPDNYVGVSDEGGLIGVDCQGSFMTNTSDDTYSEFLTDPEWLGDCLRTIAQNTTGRFDWQSVTEFYPMLAGAGGNIGPSVLPLDVTRLIVLGPQENSNAITARNFDIRNADTGALLALPSAQGYLVKTRGTPTLADDWVVGMGTTRGGGDRIKVRGAVAGDYLCVSGPLNDVVWQGCTEITSTSSRVDVSAYPDWQPEITVTPVSTGSILITVTQVVTSGNLRVQMIPAYGPPSAQTAVTSPWLPMVPIGNDTYTQILGVDYTVFQGIVRLWDPVQDVATFTEYTLDANAWSGGNARGWNGGNARGWNGGNARGWNGAPSVSSDGQLTVFNVNEPYGDTGISAYQSLSVLPDLPSWLEPVGQGFVVLEQGGYADDLERTMAYDYLQRDVPDGYEYALSIYFQADGSDEWLRLETSVDEDENRAIAEMPLDGAGIYALVATIEMPAMSQGWNLFGYPVPMTRTVDLALASIADDYTTIYDNNPSAPTPWRMHDQTVVRDHPEFAGLVNDLPYLTFGHVYWLYALTDTTPFIGVPGEGVMATNASNGVELPPATYYGWVAATPDFTPVAGMVITAVRNGVVCGQTTVVAWDSQLAYKLQVHADGAGYEGCGEEGASFTLMVAGQAMGSVAWDNSQAQYLPLPLTGGQTGWAVYLPFIQR